MSEFKLFPAGPQGTTGALNGFLTETRAVAKATGRMWYGRVSLAYQKP